MSLERRIEKLEKPLVDMALVRQKAERLAKELGLNPDELLQEAEGLIAKYGPWHEGDIEGMIKAIAKDNGLDPEEAWLEAKGLLAEAQW